MVRTLFLNNFVCYEYNQYLMIRYSEMKLFTTTTPIKTIVQYLFWCSYTIYMVPFLCILHIVSFGDLCLAICKCNIYQWILFVTPVVRLCNFEGNCINFNVSKCFTKCFLMSFWVYFTTDGSLQKQISQALAIANSCRLSPDDTEHLHTLLQFLRARVQNICDRILQRLSQLLIQAVVNPDSPWVQPTVAMVIQCIPATFRHWII